MGEIDKEKETSNADKISEMEAPANTNLPPDIDEPKITSEPNLKSLSMENVKNGNNDIGLITDIPLELSVELGRTKKPIKDILNFGIGTVIELEKIAGEHVDLYANGKLLARGEVVVVDDNFAIKIAEIVNKKNTKNDE